MKAYILNTGYLFSDINIVMAAARVGTKDNPKVENKMVKLPVMAVLLDTPRGWVLYDTGSNPNAMNGEWPAGIAQLYQLFQKPEERLEAQLALCGVKPGDINTVVVSHMHIDHLGNIGLFPHAEVYVPKADYIHALATVHANPDTATHGGYIKKDVTAPAKLYHLVEEDFELMPGIEIVNLPGHTPGLLGLMVHLEKEGTVIFPQDSVYTKTIFGPPIRPSGLMYDSLTTHASVEKVHRLARKHNAKVFYAHDEEEFPKFKLAPDYYE